MRVRISRVRVHRDGVDRFVDSLPLYDDDSKRQVRVRLRAHVPQYIVDTYSPMMSAVGIVPYRAGDRV